MCESEKILKQTLKNLNIAWQDVAIAKQVNMSPTMYRSQVAKFTVRVELEKQQFRPCEIACDSFREKESHLTLDPNGGFNAF